LQRDALGRAHQRKVRESKVAAEISRTISEKVQPMEKNYEEAEKSLQSFGSDGAGTGICSQPLALKARTDASIAITRDAVFNLKSCMSENERNVADRMDGLLFVLKQDLKNMWLKASTMEIKK